jgi:hypothetical protein
VAKVETESWSLDQDKLSLALFYLLILFLPTQFGKHFFPQFSFVYGLRIDYLSPALYLTDLIIVLLIVFSFKNIFKQIVSKHLKKLLVMVLLLLSFALSTAVSKNPAAGALGLIKLFEYLYLGIYIALNIKKINKTLVAYLAGVGICFESLLAILQYFNHGSFQGLMYFLGERAFNGQTPGIANVSINGELILRPYGTFPHPNVLAGYLNLSLMLFLYFGNKVKRHIKYLVVFLGSAGILVSFSRSGILLLFVLTVLYFGTTMLEKYKKRKMNSRVIAALPFLTVLIFSCSYFFLQNNLLIKRLTIFSLSDESVIVREKLLDKSFELFLSSPVFGVGLNNFINNLNSTFSYHNLLQVH